MVTERKEGDGSPLLTRGGEGSPILAVEKERGKEIVGNHLVVVQLWLEFNTSLWVLKSSPLVVVPVNCPTANIRISGTEV